MSALASSLACITYTLVDDGIANVLALRTLRHGTNPNNYVAIRIFGGDPAHGGKPTGSTGNLAFVDSLETCKGRFYLFKDTVDWQGNNCSNNQLNYRFCPRKHVYNSSLHFMEDFLAETFKEQTSTTRIVAVIFANISNQITPTLKFRCEKIDDRFVNDDGYCFNEKKQRMYSTERSPSVYTTQKMEAWRIGIIGSLMTGLNSRWLSRAQAEPKKVLHGVIQLTSAIALTTFFASTLIDDPLGTVLGILIA